MHLIYPSNPLRTRQPDEQFAAEVEAVRTVGFDVSVFSMEDFQGGVFRSIPTLPGGGVEILYRGWMMSASEYASFISNVTRAEARPVTLLESYLASHHLPNASGNVPSIVQECAQRLSSRFYSVDVIQRTDGQLRIVEVGDGQVSDLVGWAPEGFAEMLAKHFLKGLLEFGLQS